MIADSRASILRTMIDNIPAAVSLFDAEMRLVACNRQLIDLLEFPEAMFVGQMPTLEELARFNALRGEYGPCDVDEMVAAFMARARQRLPHHFKRTRPNGTVLDIRGAPLPDGGFVTFYSDITELTASQQDLERHVEYLRSVVRHLPQGVSVFDEHLRLKYWNQMLLDVLELPAEAVHQDVSFDDLTIFPARRGEYGPGAPEDHVAARRKLALQFQAHRFERTRPGGRTHLVEGRPMRHGENVIGFVTTYTDITDRKQSELALERQNAMLQALVANMPGGVTVFDENLKLALFNAEAKRLLEFPNEYAALQPSFADVIRYNAERGEYGDVDVEKTVAEMVERAHHPVAHHFERTRPDGTTIEVSGAPLPGGGFVTIYLDITQRKLTENELRRRNQVFQTLLDNIPGGVTLFDKEMRLVASNAEYARLLDFPPELFEGEPTLERFFRYNAERGEYGKIDDIDASVAALLARAATQQPHVFERTRPNGTVLEIRGLPLPDGGFVTIYTDITEKHGAAEAIERLAHRDTLTGLANRYNLEARLDHALAEALRHKTQVAVMFLDMDRFKAINDTQGHSVGDGFLIEVAARLTSSVRNCDIVARFGGDEFVVVLTDIADSRHIETVARKIVDAMAAPFNVVGVRIQSSVSVGIVVFPDDARDRHLLLRNADIAMYHAKRSGRGQYQRFDACLSELVLNRTRMEVDLRNALEAGEFILHYQPQIANDGERVVGFEALVRWKKDGGLVPPDQFIPIAEETGLIEALGAWVLEEACNAAVRWQARRGGATRVAVNLSRRQLKDPCIVGLVRKVLGRTGLAPALLELEVTETAAMDNPQIAIENLRALKSLGIGLAIDDFGTGYSSLAYLKLLPIDRLKLDRTFVKDIEDDTNDAVICTATIGLAHNLGLKVVAEGVETAAQLAFLRSLDCDELQGYYFSPPLPESEAREYGMG
ncbi:MAG TPA: PAS-domain containing protein [Accumulibacter sp.]|uniref:PAS-domain containing protein n=1 Tax=Accumulibacter sp. TaxID=2053492 RepID=UPI002C5CE930|nr:PAS-domain containing protein [Accumulibacter sp.]HMW56171.1 PAS-domain containing protein [Accumulibacter sp.]